MYFDNELVKAYFHTYRTFAYTLDKTEERYPVLITVPSQCNSVTLSMP
jgi:hypothetical protein